MSAVRLDPADAVEVTIPLDGGGWCDLGRTDGAGDVLLGTTSNWTPFHWHEVLIGSEQATAAFEPADDPGNGSHRFIPRQSGFVETSYSSDDSTLTLLWRDARGTIASQQQLELGDARVLAVGTSSLVVVAYELPDWTPIVETFSEQGALKWQVRPDVRPAVVGADLDGNILLLEFAVTAPGTPGPYGQWVSAAGLVGAKFAVSYDDGVSAGYELWPSLEGLLLWYSNSVRHDDGTWAFRVASNSSVLMPAPAWANSSSAVALQVLPGRKGYAAIQPDGKLELLSPRGRICGSFDLSMNGQVPLIGQRGIFIGPDGTVIQLEAGPPASEGRAEPFCRWRWWPQVLR